MPHPATHQDPTHYDPDENDETTYDDGEAVLDRLLEEAFAEADYHAVDALWFGAPA